MAYRSGSRAEELETFSLRPDHKNRFRPNEVKPVIRAVLQRKLDDITVYNDQSITPLIKEVSELVRNEIKERLDYKNYKILVHCVMGEQKGEGVRIGCKCFWDSDTDNCAEEVYNTKVLFCVCTVYGVYHY